MPFIRDQVYKCHLRLLCLDHSHDMFGVATSFTTFAIALILSAGGDARSSSKLPIYAKPHTNRLSQLSNAYEKYGLNHNYPEYLRHGPSRRAFKSESTNPSEIPVKPNDIGYEYCTPITIGEGETAKTFNVGLDTSRADFWVYSSLFNQSLLESPNGTITHNVYDPLNSTTAVSTGASFHVGTTFFGNVSGIVFHDTVTLAGITVKDQNVEAATEQDTIVRELLRRGSRTPSTRK
jgi:hypothetical protein